MLLQAQQSALRGCTILLAVRLTAAANDEGLRVQPGLHRATLPGLLDHNFRPGVPKSSTADGHRISVHRHIFVHVVTPLPALYPRAHSQSTLRR